MHSRLTDRLLVFAAALLFSTGGVAIKGNSLTSWQVASFRSLVAAIAIALFLPQSRRGWTKRHVLVGVAYAITLITFVTSTKLTTAANAIFLQSTAPAYVLFLGPLLLHEKLRRADVFLLAAVGCGMALFFVSSEPARATAPDPVTGNVIALVSGITWSLTVVGLRWLSRNDDSAHAGLATTVVGNLLAFAIALPFALPLAQISGADIAVLLYLGVFQIGLAYVCLVHAVRRVPAFQAVTLLLIEPALNPLWTWLILGERPAPLSIVGGAIILTSTLAITIVHPSREA
jgi:drug/metabolite transporter (DMT)-like permease